MILTISTTHRPATDLGFLLHKNPERHQTADLSFGTAHVLYPQATEERCSASLVVEIDPIGLVRNRRGPSGNDFSLAQYVNDRPFATSSFMSVALAKMFSTAMSGRSKECPELVDERIPLEVHLPVVPTRGEGRSSSGGSSSRLATKLKPRRYPSTPLSRSGATAAIWR